MSNPMPDADNGASAEGASPASNDLSNKLSAERFRAKWTNSKPTP